MLLLKKYYRRCFDKGMNEVHDCLTERNAQRKEPRFTTNTRARVMEFGADIMKNAKIICGAKTRKGTPCKNTRLYKNGRCKNHGGLSTGPRTAEGKARALANLTKRRFLSQRSI
jgi:hypothetical protein